METIAHTAGNFRSGQVSVPAIKCCPGCGGRKVDLRKRSSFGVAYDGRLVCARCWQKEMRDA